MRASEFNDVIGHDVRRALSVLVAAFVTNPNGLKGGFLELLLRVEQCVARLRCRSLVEISFGMRFLLGGLAQIVDSVDLFFGFHCDKPSIARRVWKV